MRIWMVIRVLFRPMIIHDETLYFYSLMITLINNNYIDGWYDMTLWRCEGRTRLKAYSYASVGRLWLVRILWWYQLTRTVPESVWHLDSLEPLESSWKYNQFGQIILLQRVFGVSLWINICRCTLSSCNTSKGFYFYLTINPLFYQEYSPQEGLLDMKNLLANVM